MNEGNVFVCATSMKGNRSKLCAGDGDSEVRGGRGRRESQIKNQSCVLVTHFHDVFPEFSTRHSVNDILNTFDSSNKSQDFQKNDENSPLWIGKCVFGFHQLQVASDFSWWKAKNVQISSTEKKFALHHFEGSRWIWQRLKDSESAEAIEGGIWCGGERETAAIDCSL